MNQSEPEDPGTRPPEADGSREPTVESPTPEQEVARLRDECAQLESRLQRQLADAANVRRRQRQEMDDQKRRVIEGLAQDLLPALDSLGMALAAFDAGASDAKALVEGVRLTHALLVGALERHGLQQIEAEGQTFDPQRHEAVAVEPSAGVPEGAIVRVLQSGYALGDRVVRHARVVVAGPGKT